MEMKDKNRSEEHGEERYK